MKKTILAIGFSVICLFGCEDASEKQTISEERLKTEISQFSRSLSRGNTNAAFAGIETYSDANRADMESDFSQRTGGQDVSYVGDTIENDGGDFKTYSIHAEIGEKRTPVEIEIRAVRAGDEWEFEKPVITENADGPDLVEQEIEKEKKKGWW